MPKTWMNVVVTLATPALWLILRFSLGLAGWTTFMYMMFGAVIAVIVGGILTLIFAYVQDSERARRARRFYLAGVACHLASAITFSDYGDSDTSSVTSPVGYIVGADITYILGLLLLIAWLILSIVAAVMALNARRRDNNEWRETRDPHLR